MSGVQKASCRGFYTNARNRRFWGGDATASLCEGLDERRWIKAALGNI